MHATLTIIAPLPYNRKPARPALCLPTCLTLHLPSIHTPLRRPQEDLNVDDAFATIARNALKNETEEELYIPGEGGAGLIYHWLSLGAFESAELRGRGLLSCGGHVLRFGDEQELHLWASAVSREVPHLLPWRGVVQRLAAPLPTRPRQGFWQLMPATSTDRPSLQRRWMSIPQPPPAGSRRAAAERATMLCGSAAAPQQWRQHDTRVRLRPRRNGLEVSQHRRAVAQLGRRAAPTHA